MDSRAIEGSGNCEVVDSKGPRNWDQIKVPGLHPSISMTDLMNHIESRLSEQMAYGNPPVDGSDNQNILDDIAQYLLNDNQLTTSNDEKRLMARVNSLCCLLQKDPSVQNLQVFGESCIEGSDKGKGAQLNVPNEAFYENRARGNSKEPEGGMKDVSCSRPPAGMSRKDSFGDMLLQLPRIASLPKFLFNISEEDGESQAR